MPDHARRLTYGYEAIQEKNIGIYDDYPMNSTSAGFTMIGMSGVGKTTAVERVLSLYPQCIEHFSMDKKICGVDRWVEKRNL
jgi:putative ribosome biogenesis GTPase RsgA